MLTIKAKVHLLATENRSKIILCHNDYLQFDEYFGSHFVKSAISFKHLYFTTDEEIKEGDKVLHDGEVKTAILLGMFLGFKWKDADKDRSEHFDKHNWPKKIVATTNPELWKNKWTSGEYEPSTPFQSITQGIPKIDIPFIEAYIKAYNEGKPITEVWLELRIFVNQYNTKGKTNDKRLGFNLTTKGEVITHPVLEKMYTREQVVEMLYALKWEENGLPLSDKKLYKDYVRRWVNERFPE